MNGPARLLLALALATTAAPAFAQGLSSSMGGAPSAPKEGPKQAPPPALPGSRAEPPSVAPAERPPGDMPPTEALFDAINRGDLGSAKDAIARGADLNGRNVLGVTPLEQSVDLGRNDISFLLLSLRGTGDQAPLRPGERDDASAIPSAAERRAAAAERRAQLAEERRLAKVARASTSTGPRNARLFAGDGGAPVPQAGFLGFDAGRQR